MIDFIRAIHAYTELRNLVTDRIHWMLHRVAGELQPNVPELASPGAFFAWRSHRCLRAAPASVSSTPLVGYAAALSAVGGPVALSSA